MKPPKPAMGDVAFSLLEISAVVAVNGYLDVEVPPKGLVNVVLKLVTFRSINVNEAEADLPSERSPTYTVGSDGAATTTEKGLTQVFSTDATYCLIGLVVGLIIGCLSWVLMRRRGAWGVLAAGISACLSALACWWVGVLIGPDSFAERIASAKSGEVIPIDFALHTWVAVLVWLLAAMVPMLIASLLAARRGASRTGRAKTSTGASLD